MPTYNQFIRLTQTRRAKQLTKEHGYLRGMVRRAFEYLNDGKIKQYTAIISYISDVRWEWHFSIVQDQIRKEMKEYRPKTKKYKKLRICPKCRKKTLIFYANITRYLKHPRPKTKQYKCKNCGYTYEEDRI